MIHDAELDKLVQAGIITAGQREQILTFQANAVEEAPHPSPTIPFFRTLYYLGGFILIFAIVYYVSDAWEELGNLGRIFWTLGGMAVFGGAALALGKTTYRAAGSLLLLASVACVPILIIAIERAMGYLPKDALWGAYNGQNHLPIDLYNRLWLAIDSLTLLVSVVLIRKLREAILILPVFLFLWLTALDAFNLITAQTAAEGLNVKCWIGVAVGLLAVYSGVRDLKREGRMTVWCWLFGLLLIVGSLLALRFDQHHDPVKLIYQINVLIYALAVLLAASPLRSRIFLVFGGFGMFWFIQDISWTYFRNSLGFTLVLAISGLVTIAFGILLQRLYTKRFRLEH